MIKTDSNGFRHQDYSEIPNPESFELLAPAELIHPESASFSDTMSKTGDRLRSNQVSRIILVHGTLAGTDALGWYSHWQRVVPGLSTQLKSTYKSMVDRLAGDRGNFNSRYLELLLNSLNHGVPHAVNDPNTDSLIEVERFDWTSENHHLGRADAAVSLALRLIELAENGDKRIILIGHSHAGNVFALISNLFGNSAADNNAFFECTRHFHLSTGRADIAQWNSLKAMLLGENWKRPKLDLVTMGTPVRYGWDSNGFENLLHFVNHHPVDDTDSFRAYVPKNPKEFLAAANGTYGDLVQQTFVARTDLPPAIWSWAAWKANRKLRNLLESTELNNKRLWRFQQGKRVHDSGKTLLVDYAIADETALDVAGHSIYTELDWMAWHMNEIALRFYSE